MLRLAQKSRVLSFLQNGTIYSVRCSGNQNQVIDYKEQKEKLLQILNEPMRKPYDGPERDLVNFPRKVRAVNPGVIRHGFVPQEWLDFFYKKTGVTGPYLFGLGLTTFLCSKELYVIEDEFSTAVALIILTVIGFKTVGPKLRAYGEDLVVKDQAKTEAFRTKAFEELNADIANEKKLKWQASLTTSLIQAKRENVHMQLDTEYRSRMMNVYKQVKRRLDYFLEMDTTRKKLEQKHMVDWIVENVQKGITQQQEKEALQKCIADLKILSARAV